MIKLAIKLGFKTCILCFFLAISAIAPVSGISVSGFYLITEVAPGDHIRHVMTANIGDVTPTDMIAQINGCGTDPSGMRIALNSDEDTSPYSAREFLKVSPERARLESGKPAEFILEGDVPKDVGSGGRYAIVTIQTVPAGNGSVGVSAAIEVPIYLTIADSDIIETGEIIGLEITDNDDALLADVTFKNTGNHHYKASAEILLKDKNGEVVDRTVTPSDLDSTDSIIPTFSRHFQIYFDNEDLGHGAYTIVAIVTKEDGTVLDTEETTFEV